MKILILGGAGFLGSNLARYCLDHSAEVTVMDSLDPRLKSSEANLAPIRERITFLRANILDDAALESAVSGQEIIFNCAAQSSHPLSLHDPFFDAEVNCIGNLKLLETVRRIAPECAVVYPSSSTVTGKMESDVIDESHGEKPLDIYSAHKGVAEKYYRIYHRVHGLKTVAIRFPNLYGPGGKGFPEFGFVNYFIDRAWKNEPITIFGDGHQSRNVLFVDDAAEILFRAATDERLRGEAWFAAHDEHLSVKAIAERIVSVLGRGSVVSVPWPDERKQIEVDRVLISSAKLRAITGWKPRHSFDEGLAKTKAALA